MSFTVTGRFMGQRITVTYNSKAHRLEGDPVYVRILTTLLQTKYEDEVLGVVPSPKTRTFRDHLRSPISMLAFLQREMEVEEITGDIPGVLQPGGPDAVY